MEIVGYTDLYRKAYGDLKNEALRNGEYITPSYVLDGKLEVVTDTFTLPHTFETGDSIHGSFLKRPGTLVDLVVYQIKATSEDTSIRFFLKTDGKLSVPIFDYDTTDTYISMTSQDSPPLEIDETSYIIMENYIGQTTSGGEYNVIAFIVRQ